MRGDIQQRIVSDRCAVGKRQRPQTSTVDHQLAYRVITHLSITQTTHVDTHQHTSFLEGLYLTIPWEESTGK